MGFKQWSGSAVSEYTCEFGGCGIRDVYTLPCGAKIYDEVYLPRSIFQPQHQQTLVDVTLPVSKEPWLKETYGASLDCDHYTEEGFGYPVFKGEGSTERAFEFAEREYRKVAAGVC